MTELERDIHAESGAHLQLLLRQNHRYIFTLIQKFHTEPGVPYPAVSDRSDIIVITDEAHRSQYDTFALNMRSALPRAAFIAFTGTPLIVGEEKTREVFGDYVSIYNFRQSVEDGTTVPLYYENRIPELQLTNPNLNANIEGLIEAADLDEDQEQKLEREFAREYHLITRDDRLEKIAEDLVAHFLARGQPGKAMVVCIDKATTVRMYDKVRRYWQATLASLRAQLAPPAITYPQRSRNVSNPLPGRPGRPGERSVPPNEDERASQRETIASMEQTDMAVVVSQSQNEIADFRAKGLDIAPHRRRVVTEDLETKFKDPNDPLRIVFVCAMWMTGFDVPSLTTIYLDKPMRNHTLMQTIARANRVFADKTNGLIVDYVGVFRNLQKALAIYGTTRGGFALDGGEDGEASPVQDKSELLAALRLTIEETKAFCELHGVGVQSIIAAQGFERVNLLDDAVEALVVNDEVRKKYLGLATNVAQLYRAILPDTSAGEFTPATTLFVVLTSKIRALAPEPDISGVMAAIEKLLDESIASEGYVIHEPPGTYRVDRRVDLGQIDFEALRAKFERARKHTMAQELRGVVERKLQELVSRNRTRMNYLEQFQRLIEEYNAGSMNIEVFFDRLVALARELNAEEQRAVAEQLTEEELAIFDLLTRPDVQLTVKDKEQVKRAARDLLVTLKREKLVLDWKKRQATRAAVKLAIRKVFDVTLPPIYTQDLYAQKCDQVYEHIYDAYAGAGQSIYAA